MESRPLPKVNVHAEPGSQRCFETEQAQLTLWADTETFGTAVELTVSAIDGMRLEVLQRTSRQRQTVATTADRWGRYPIRATVDVIAHGGLLAGTGTVDAADVTVFPMTPPQATALPPTELLDRLGLHEFRRELVAAAGERTCARIVAVCQSCARSGQTSSALFRGSWCDQCARCQGLQE